MRLLHGGGLCLSLLLRVHCDHTQRPMLVGGCRSGATGQRTEPRLRLPPGACVTRQDFQDCHCMWVVHFSVGHITMVTSNPPPHPTSAVFFSYYPLLLFVDVEEFQY